MIRAVVELEANESRLWVRCGEAELDAAGAAGMDLTVEESGNPVLLAECIAHENMEGAVDVLHISCHGTIEKTGPVLMLETEEGGPCHTSADELARNLGGNKPNLLFLSACMTSQPDALLNSYSSRMLRSGIPAVLGWGGSVGDAEANRFAAGFYRYLSQSHHLEEAVAWSRQELLEGGELHRVKSRLVEAVRAVIEAFSAAVGNTRSRLLLTGRYRFALPHKGRDLATMLLQVHLPPMEEYEGRKQAAAKEKVNGYWGSAYGSRLPTW